MGVRAADPERIDTGPPRLVFPFPINEPAIHMEWRLAKVDSGIWRGEMKTGRDFLVIEGQHGLHEADHARGDLEVAHVSFDRAQSTVAALIAALAKDMRQAGYFNGIT